MTHGAMVGRAVINRPCAFAGIDEALNDGVAAPDASPSSYSASSAEPQWPPVATTRGELLDSYIAYVEAEEEAAAACEERKAQRRTAPPEIGDDLDEKKATEAKSSGGSSSSRRRGGGRGA